MPVARNQRKKLPNPAKYSPHRKAWANLSHHEIILYHGADEDRYVDDVRAEDEVRLMIRSAGRAMRMTLSAMTEKELETLREIFNIAIETALPICREMDQLAQEAFDAGDDAYARLYRPVPTIYVRERSQQPHDESVPDGPTPVLGLRAGYHRPSELREIRRRMVDGEQVEVEPEDDGEAPDDPA
jgi:hypothetical protein